MGIVPDVRVIEVIEVFASPSEHRGQLAFNASPEVSFEDRMATTEFRVAAEAHIVVDGDACRGRSCHASESRRVVGPQRGVAAVSYTHLDVYKRQGPL